MRTFYQILTAAIMAMTLWAASATAQTAPDFDGALQKCEESAEEAKQAALVDCNAAAEAAAAKPTAANFNKALAAQKKKNAAAAAKAKAQTMRRAHSTSKSDIMKLAQEIDDLQGGMASLAPAVGGLLHDVAVLTQRVDVIEKSSLGWNTDLLLGIYASNGIGNAEQGFQFGWGQRHKASGLGANIGMQTGFNGLFGGGVHLSSFLIRTNGSIALGSARWWNLDLGLFVGGASKTSLGADPGLVYGVSSMLNFAPDFLRGVSVGVGADASWGRLEGGPIWMARIAFDPTK